MQEPDELHSAATNMNNSANHVQHVLQDIKVEEIEIKEEPLLNYQEDLHVHHMVQQINYSWLKQENQENQNEDLPDAMPQAQGTSSSSCYYCGISDKEKQRRTIITRQYQKKLDTHEICKNY